MKILSFIISLSMALPAQASLFGSPGHGDTQELCAYNQSPARVYKPQSVIDAEAKLKAAKDKLAGLEKELERMDCSYCESNFRKVISIVDKDNYNEYIRHLEGGSACSLAFTNVDVYNYWASINNWEKIELFTRPQNPIRNIAGGNSAGGCPEGETCGELGEGTPTPEPPSPPAVTRPEPRVPDAPPGCPYYAGPDYSVKGEACEVAQPHISTSEYKKCVKCLSPRGKRSYGKCLRQSARLEEQIAEVEEEIEELEEDLEDAVEDAEQNGEGKVCADCMKDDRSTFAKLFPTLLTGTLVGGASYLTYKSAKNSYEEQIGYERAYHANVTAPDNNKKGYPTDRYSDGVSDTSFKQAAQVGLMGLPLVLNTAQSSGMFGCSAGGVFGQGTLTSGQGAGMQVGGATGLSGILSGMLGVNGNVNGGNTNGVTTGQAAIPAGYAMGANGQLIYVGNGTGVNGQPTLSTAELDAQIRAKQAQLAQLNEARTYNASYSSLTSDYHAQLNALGPNPAASGNIYGQGGHGVMAAPSSNSVLQGGISLSLGAQGGNSVMMPQQPVGMIPQPPTTTIPIGTPGVVTPNVAPPTTTQPTGINRLIGL